MYYLCSLSGDYSWQVTSIAIEKELGNFLQKDFFIKYCHKYGLDLSRTYTCFKSGLYACGECMGCIARKMAFETSKISDSTIYANRLFLYRIIKKIKKLPMF
jgi:7-cyano-7-deazaguanine synthase in queuosine biosynthesis